jgi:hypothetical protein
MTDKKTHSRKLPRAERAKLEAAAAPYIDAMTRVARGAHPEVAAVAAGLARDSFSDSAGKGYARQREAKHECLLVQLVAEAGHRDWRAAAWLLERGYSERWRRPEDRPDPIAALVAELGDETNALAWLRNAARAIELRIAARGNARVQLAPAPPHESRDEKGGQTE